MVKKIGIYGGTFNPIHIAHLRSAIETLDILTLDELKIIPNYLPPHREAPKVTAQHRAAMITQAIVGLDKITMDDRELKRDQPSYTIDTLISIRQELTANDQLFFIMGWDAFCGLPSWKQWQELLNYCHILVLQRPRLSVKIPQELECFLKGRVANLGNIIGANGQVIYAQQHFLDISSTQIREHLIQNKSVKFLLPDTVLDYINEHQLY